jgi:hypothetical protein
VGAGYCEHHVASFERIEAAGMLASVEHGSDAAVPWGCATSRDAVPDAVYNGTNESV